MVESHVLRSKIWNQLQHPYKHSLTEFAFTNPALPGVTNVDSALQWLLAVLYPQTQESVATPAALPLVGNNINDYRVVLDDGDGKAASYRWEQREGDVAPQWYKIYDMDWGEQSILSNFLLQTQDVYVYKYGISDKDENGDVLTGTDAGQHIFGGDLANQHLTLHANSGDGVGANTGFIQFDDNSRPIVNNTYDMGTVTEKFKTGYFGTSILAGDLTLSDGSILSSSGAISFGNENLSTTGTLGAGASTLGVTTVNGEVKLQQITTPANPAAGYDSLYFKNDDKLYRLTSAGVEKLVGLEFTSTNDNRLIRSDGTGGDALQESGITVSDTDEVSGLGNLLPAGNDAQDMGSLTNAWKDIYVENRVVFSVGGTLVGDISPFATSVQMSAENQLQFYSGQNATGVNGGMTFETGVATLNSGFISFITGESDDAGSGGISFATGDAHFDSAGVTPSGSILFQTGEQLSTGNSGDVEFISGPAGGTSGNIVFTIGEGSSADGLIKFQGVSQLENIMRPNADNTIDLGTTALNFKDIYLQGNLSDGTNNVAIATLLAFRDALVGVADGHTLFYDNASGKFLPSIPDTEVDHGSVSGLGDDDHTQYLLLAGRSGGQEVIGGTDANDGLTLESTSNATKGSIRTKDNLTPFDNAIFTTGWSGQDLGDPTHYFRNLYTKGELFGARLENVLSTGLPAFSANNKGRLVYATDTEKLYVDTGSQFKVAGVGKYINDEAFNGVDLTKTVDVSSNIQDARNAIVQLLDNANNFERIYCKLEAISQTQIRITTNIALPAGSYRLIVME